METGIAPKELSLNRPTSPISYHPFFSPYHWLVC
ncbi:rCG30187 [Rattus norvegicus]|uniref:RCG30187 n=1 Tax=Rattus norvegicus TaxID=10116 RepID=A6ILC3_RAT|nr:rCG30187 [Rattus norvegicus]